MLTSHVSWSFVLSLYIHILIVNDYILYFDNKILSWQASCRDALRYMGDSVMVCAWVTVWAWTYKHVLWAKDSHSNSCTHVHWFPPKRVWHPWSIMWWCIGDMGTCIWHQWHQYWRDIKGWTHEWRGIQVADIQSVQVPSHNCRVPQCVLVPGLPGMFN